ncbi:MAG: uracil-DNA glycosylase [Clostridiales bacterium]|jgi:uracil-DNA glycosylase|nr:uracil-DNA glycosylase [Clostridiales bacterium]
MIDLGNDWGEKLKNEFKKDYYKNLRKTLVYEYKNFKIHPKPNEIFNALKFTSYKKVKVVILGQDPYHDKNQAHGLCFSVVKGALLPPSLKNIFVELEKNTGIKLRQHGDLTAWACQGVLLLNTVLTVRHKNANSHKGIGWEIFTDKIISLLNEKTRPVIFVLWGKNALTKKRLITNPIHKILEAAHPSPLSANNGFFGCKHFSIINKILSDMNEEIINWQN